MNTWMLIISKPTNKKGVQHDKVLDKCIRILKVGSWCTPGVPKGEWFWAFKKVFNIGNGNNTSGWQGS